MNVFSLEHCRFESLKVKDIFYYMGIYYVRVEEKNGYNALRLDQCYLSSFQDHEAVRKVCDIDQIAALAYTVHEMFFS